jgi:hypothetical protein
MVLHLLPGLLLDRNPDNVPGLITSGSRIKGLKPALKLFRKTENGSELLNNGDTAFEGDLIRLGYQAAGSLYGVIISVDGRGAVTQHFPRSGAKSGILQTGKTILLDFSYELDDAPHWERFYFVTDKEPFTVEPVLKAGSRIDIQAAASSPPPLEIDEKQDQYVITLKKETIE